MKKGINFDALDVKFDASQQAFTDEQLRYIQKKVYRTKYRKLKARQYLPVSYDIPEWATSHEYNMYSHFGLMQLIESYADDLPLAAVAVEKVKGDIRAYGLAYEYSVYDLQKVANGGIPLNTEQAMACRRGWEELVESVAWYGDEKANIPGLLYHPNITVAQALTGDWTTATPKQIYDDVAYVWEVVFNATNGEEEIDHIGIAQNRWAKVKNTILYDNKTILTVLKENFEGITFFPLKELNDMDPRPSGLAGTANCMVGYIYDSEYVTLEIPEEFKQHSPQTRNLAVKVNTTGKTAGVTLRYPLSVALVEDI